MKHKKAVCEVSHYCLLHYCHQYYSCQNSPWSTYTYGEVVAGMSMRRREGVLDGLLFLFFLSFFVLKYSLQCCVNWIDLFMLEKISGIGVGVSTI